VAIVPADEVGGGVTARQLLAGDAERTVLRRAGGVDDRVVALEQLLARDVHAEGNVVEVAKAWMDGGLLIHAGDRLDLGVIGGDA
jgi:hypothetical protein